MDDERVASLVLGHVARYPAAETMDIYKLLHQATFGPGHLVSNKKAAREWLEQEMGQNTPSRNEPLIESVHPDAALVRLHLRPYMAYGGTVKPLLDAFIHSAEQVTGAPETMAQRWHVVVDLCRSGALDADQFPPQEVILFGRMRERELWPAVHHSPVYNETYHPVYRVLVREDAEGLCRKLGAPFEIV